MDPPSTHASGDANAPAEKKKRSETVTAATGAVGDEAPKSRSRARSIWGRKKSVAG